MSRNNVIFIFLFFAILLLFILDLAIGSIHIELKNIIKVLIGEETKESTKQIILNIRLPKAITAIVAGAGISICGLLMQTLFRNPLADTSILGISSGAGLGVGSFIMLSSLFPMFFSQHFSTTYWGMIVFAILGASLVLVLISIIIHWLQDIISVLIIGVMFGFITGSIISVLQFFSKPEVVKSFLMWTFGNINNTTWEQLYYMIPLVVVGISGVFTLPKQLNAILLGEFYARGVGVNIKQTRLIIISLTALIIGVLTAFVGPIAFLGIAIPHFSRILFKTANHTILIPATILCGIFILLLCDIITHLPSNGVVLPINAVTSILGAPVVIFIILKRRANKTVF